MIILSFTRRDAEALKDKALQILFNNLHHGGGNQNEDSRKSQEHASLTRNLLKEQLWCGTIHSFAINILKKYNFNNVPLRIISTKEMKTRVRNCLGRIHASDKERMMLYRAAMEQSKQSIGTLVNDIIRCLELWKEAGVLSTPYAYTIQNLDMKYKHENELSQDDYVELAMRLGIPQEVARLALDISGDYQVCHANNIDVVVVDNICMF
jgi:superfamily I DNA/RNA helicase